jgi:hypothetical protein
MRFRIWLWVCLFIAVLGITLAYSQNSTQKGRHEVRMPDGRLQRDLILKDDVRRSLEDVDKVIELAQELKDEIEKNQTYVVSVTSIKKTEEIEKLVKRIRGRLRRQ